MDIIVREYEEGDILAMISIWNEVVRQGVAFPQKETLDEDSGRAFFEAQSFCAVAVVRETEEVVGLYILHPNNVGRCAHIANASYAVASGHRGAGVGRALVNHCLRQARALRFSILQFNAVVCSNEAAIALYEKLGFVRLGKIPGGFLNKDGVYEDIFLYYILL